MKAELDVESVTRYLQDHPEFLAQMHIPSPHGDGAISLTERQMQTLREKCRLLESKLAELIRFGEDNDAIGEKMHHLGVALLAASDFPAVLRALYSHLGGAFAVPHLAMRLWDVPAVVEAAEFAAVGDTVRAQAGALTHPYCGPGAGQEALAWLGDTGGRVRSMALIPLRRDGRSIGALLLASEEPHRFYAEMGTLYLARIGDMAAAAALRTLS
jgi:uncharacterized protein YigA (DUF484 family)